MSAPKFKIKSNEIKFKEEYTNTIGVTDRNQYDGSDSRLDQYWIELDNSAMKIYRIEQMVEEKKNETREIPLKY